jgi:hypothetical protein
MKSQQDKKIISKWKVLWTCCLARAKIAMRLIKIPTRETLKPIGPSNQYLNLNFLEEMF